MREIDLMEYEKLRRSGFTLTGRVVPHCKTFQVIYFAIPKDQQSFSCTEILDTLVLTHPNLKGEFDVIRHWTYPEIKLISYRV